MTEITTAQQSHATTTSQRRPETDESQIVFHAYPGGGSDGNYHYSPSENKSTEVKQHGKAVKKTQSSATR